MQRGKETGNFNSYAVAAGNPSTSTSHQNPANGNVPQPQPVAEAAGPSSDIGSQSIVQQSSMEDDVWGDDEAFLFATQMMELDQQLTPAPVRTEAELESLKEINEFARWNAMHSQASQLPNEELINLKKKLSEMESVNEKLKVNNYTLQGEASNLRRRLDEQAAQKQHEVFQKLKGIEETRKREAEEKKRVQQTQETLKSELQLAKIELRNLEQRNRQLAKRDSLGNTQSVVSPAAVTAAPGAQSQLAHGSTSVGPSKQHFPTKKSFFSNEVKPQVDSKEIQTDAAEPDPIPSSVKQGTDIKSEIYEQLKRVLKEGAEREFIDVMRTVNSAVEAAPEAFAKDVPMVTVVHGKGLESVDPVLSVFHYLNIRDNDTFVNDECLQEEYLRRKNERYDMALIEARLDSESQEMGENSSEEDSEGCDRKITYGEDYQVGDAYSTSDDDGSDVDDRKIASSPAVSWSDTDSEKSFQDFHSRPKFVCQEDIKRGKQLMNIEQFPYVPGLEEPMPSPRKGEEEAVGSAGAQSIADPVLAPNEPGPPSKSDDEDDFEVEEIDDEMELVSGPGKASPETILKHGSKTKETEAYLSGGSHHSLGSSLISSGFLVTIITVRSELQKVMDSVNDSDEGALFLSSDKLREFVNLVIWAKYLWRGIAYEQRIRRTTKIYKTTDWKKGLMEWTELMIRTVWRYFSSLEELEHVVRKMFLNTMGTILRIGYFDHTANNYNRLFTILYDCLVVRLNGKIPCLMSTLEILRYAAKTKTTYKYLCRESNDDGKCFTNLISERTIEEFRQDNHCGREQMRIFDDYLSLIEVLNEPAEAHPSLIRNDHEDDPFPDIYADRPGAKRRRTEHGAAVCIPSSSSGVNPLLYINELKSEAQAEKNCAQEEPDLDIGSAFKNVKLSYIGRSTDRSWLHSSHWEAPSGTRNLRCQCRKHLINNLMLMIDDLWQLFEEEDREWRSRLRESAMGCKGFDPDIPNCYIKSLSRALDFLVNIYQQTEDIAVAFGSSGFCCFWRLLGYYRRYKDTVCSKHQLSLIDQLTHDPEDELPNNDTWRKDEWDACKAQYPWLDPAYSGPPDS